MRDSYENSVENMSDLEIIIGGLKRRYNFSNCGSNCYDIFIFISEVIRIPMKFLIMLGADQESYYEHMTLEEAIEIILLRLISQDDRIPAKDGFPQEYNFKSGQDGLIQQLENGKTWLPYIHRNGGRFPNCDRILLSIEEQLNLNPDEGLLLFHGTSWDSAMTIMEHVMVTDRPYATDFGKYNFYTTDTFYNAVKWARHNSQAAVVVFYIPNEYFEELITKDLSDINEWKLTVFKARIPPKRSNNPSLFRKEIREYERFIQNLDSNDLVMGPIFANPRALNVESVQYIRNQDEKVPYQYSFKRSSVDILQNLIVTTLFFNDME